MIIKDNFQTIGLQTAAGNIALKGYTPIEGRLPGPTNQGGRRHRPRKVKHGRIRIQ